jgi:eukaryotic-like serine/threonine-protein kinase
VADADGSRAVPLTSMDAMATTGTARWSPDGRSIVFDSNAGGAYHLYIVSAEGGRPRPLTTGTSRNFIGSWSPDGQWIYFTSERAGQLDTWRVAPSGGEPEQVTRTGSTGSLASPDSRWLYYVKGEGVDGLWRMPIGGGEETRLVDAIVRCPAGQSRPTGRG